MKRRLFLYVITGFIAIACGKNKKPDDTLSRAKMENIIWDIVMADEYVQTYLLKDSGTVDLDAERYKLYEQVFKLHNTTKEQFRKSYAYYSSRPGETKVLFDSLSSKASRRTQEVYMNAK